MVAALNLLSCQSIDDEHQLSCCSFRISCRAGREHGLVLMQWLLQASRGTFMMQICNGKAGKKRWEHAVLLLLAGGLDSLPNNEWGL